MLLLAVALMLLEFAAEKVTGVSYKFNTYSGESMAQTYHEGDLLLVAFFLRNQALQPGDVGCFDDKVLAAAKNRSSYVICHHVNATTADGYIFHTDKVCSTYYDDYGNKIINCQIYEDNPPKEWVVGKIAWSGPRDWLLIGILAATAVVYYLQLKRDEDGKKNEPMRPLPIERNLQHTRSGGRSGDA